MSAEKAYRQWCGKNYRLFDADEAEVFKAGYAAALQDAEKVLLGCFWRMLDDPFGEGPEAVISRNDAVEAVRGLEGNNT